MVFFLTRFFFLQGRVHVGKEKAGNLLKREG